MDDIDQRLLAFLESDSRMSYTDLGKKLGLSDVAVRKRIDRLVENGTITNFSLNIDHSKVGKPLHAFILLRCKPSDAGEVLEGVKKIDAVRRIFQMLGPYDLMLEIHCAGTSELKAVADERIGSLHGVNEIRTMIIV